MQRRCVALHEENGGHTRYCMYMQTLLLLIMSSY
jgi:hypothetical protein